MRRRTIVKGLGILPVAGSGLPFARAAEEPFRIVVPYTAGGLTDIMARLLAASMEKTLGQTVLVENRPGAAALVGTKHVIQASPDGNTVLFHNSGMVAVSKLRNDPPYDPGKDLVPVARVAEGPSFLMVHESVPVRTLMEFLEYARSVSAPIPCGNAGINSGGHIAALMLEKLGGLKIAHIPYKGSSEFATALISGEVKMVVSVTTQALNPHIKSGKIRVLGTSSMQRSKLAPEVPSLREQLPLWQNVGWYGLLAPVGTSAARRAEIAASVEKALAGAELQQRLMDLYFEPAFEDPDTFAATVDSSIKYYDRIIPEFGLKKT